MRGHLVDRRLGEVPADEAGEDVADAPCRGTTCPSCWPTNFGGASFVTFERPTGDRHSSPNVWNR